MGQKTQPAELPVQISSDGIAVPGVGNSVPGKTGQPIQKHPDHGLAHDHVGQVLLLEDPVLDLVQADQGVDALVDGDAVLEVDLHGADLVEDLGVLQREQVFAGGQILLNVVILRDQLRLGQGLGWREENLGVQTEDLSHFCVWKKRRRKSAF